MNAAVQGSRIVSKQTFIDSRQTGDFRQESGIQEECAQIKALEHMVEAREEHGSDVVGLPSPADSGSRYPNDNAILAAAQRIGETVLGPNAQISDRAPGPNPDNFRALAEAGLLGLAVPAEYGGLDASGSAMRDYSEILASYCGVTAFVQAQHHGPCRMIFNSGNEHLKRCLLPDLAAGRRMCAVSFAHLRRPGPAVLRAEPLADGSGYRLNGTTPWVTGWGLMDQVVFGATLPDDRFVYLWVPGSVANYAEVFSDIRMPYDYGQLTASKPLALCAMNASATVELTCENLFVPIDHKLSESDRPTMQRNDRNGVLGATAMPMGCTLASVRLLVETAERRNISAVHHAADHFSEELNTLRKTILEWQSRTAEPEFFANAVRLRAQVIGLAVRAAHAAVTASSGGANSLDHPAQRLYREAMFYTIQAQTHDVMDATLSLLEGDIGSTSSPDRLSSPFVPH